jgi:hypothetical protein
MLMKNDLFALSLGFGALIWAAQNAQAAETCGERQAVIAQLQARYGETRQAIGLGGNNAVMEVFASAETGSWTILVTLPTGRTCLIAAGEAFEALPEVPRVPGDPV